MHCAPVVGSKPWQMPVIVLTQCSQVRRTQIGAMHMLNVLDSCGDRAFIWHCRGVCVDLHTYASSLVVHGPQLRGLPPVDNELVVACGLGGTATIALRRCEL